MPAHKAGAESRRITVNLSPRAWEAKDSIIRRGSAANLTDAVNRALRQYDMFEALAEGGARVVVHGTDGSETIVVTL